MGTIGEIDAYMLPDAKGYTAAYCYLLGISDEERQARRCASTACLRARL